MKTLKRLARKYFKHFVYFYGHLRYRIFLALGLSLTVATLDGFGLAMFLPLLQMVDSGEAGDAESMGNLRFLVDGMTSVGLNINLVSVLAVMLFFFVLKGVAKFFEAYYKVILSRFFIKNLRFANIDKLSGFSYKAFVTADAGRIQNTLSGEVGRVLNGYQSYFMAVQAGIMVFVYVILAFLANPKFAVLVAVGGGLSNFVYQRIYVKTKEASKGVTRGGHNFQALLIQKVAFFKYLKATGLMELYAMKLKQTVLEIERISRKMGLYNSILSSTKEPLMVVVVVAVVILQVSYFSEPLGLIILSLLFFYRSLIFLMSLQTQWNNFLNVSGSLENMTIFMRELTEGQEKSGMVDVNKFTNELELKNISFSYGPSAIFKDFSLTIRKNETVAFVGESGSGKTTLVNLLTGLMPIDEGEFLIDGKRSDEVNMSSYQKRIGYITQEPVIFSDSVFNNVTCWAEKTKENQLRFWQASRKAFIDSFVQSLPEKENALLGNNGVLISGGQKQRISIARELFKDIDILIMDEATSALDSETEQVIRENIDFLKGRYTILLVAHRLATIKNADRVVLLNKGRIEDTGSFEQLKSNSKLFEKMVSLQEV